MLNPCTLYVPGCDGASEVPLRNLSSEAPDVPIFVGRKWDQDHTDDPVLHWTAEGCGKICTSEVSQEEADLCAQQLALICAPDDVPVPDPIPDDPDCPNCDPPPVCLNCDDGTIYRPPTTGGGGTTGGGSPTCEGENCGKGGGGGGNCVVTPTHPCNDGKPKLYANTEQRYEYNCGEGRGTFTKVVDAGKFVAETQAKADALAYAYAQQQAMKYAICLGDPYTDRLCLYNDLAVDNTITRIPILGMNKPYYATVTGDVPSGTTAVLAETGNYIFLQGTPDASGTYTMHVKVIDNFGNSKERDYTWYVGGIDKPPTQKMTDGIRNVPYSYQFTMAGMEGVGNWAFAGYPDGLTWTNDGLLTGTPTQKGDFKVGVAVTDGGGWECSNTFDLHIADCADFADQTINVGCPCGGVVQPTFQFDEIPCEQLIRVKSCNLSTACASCAGATITVRVFKPDGTELPGSGSGGWFASLVGPYGREIDTSFLIPAKPAGTGGKWTVTVSGVSVGCP